MRKNAYRDPYNYDPANVYPGHDILTTEWANLRGPVYEHVHRLCYGIPPLPPFTKATLDRQRAMSKAMESPPAPGPDVLLSDELVAALKALGAGIVGRIEPAELARRWRAVELLLPPAAGELDPPADGANTDAPLLLGKLLKRLRRTVAYNDAVSRPGLLSKAASRAAAKNSARAIVQTLVDMRALTTRKDVSARANPTKAGRDRVGLALDPNEAWPPPVDDPAVVTAARRAKVSPAALASALNLFASEIADGDLAELESAGLFERRPDNNLPQRTAAFWALAEAVASDALSQASQPEPERVVAGLLS
jgi:hypothetical protein